MVVYYTENGAAVEVVATYIETNDPTTPLRMRMTLNEGDRVSFGLPGFRNSSFTFQRSGTQVTVRSETKSTKLVQQ